MAHRVMESFSGTSTKKIKFKTVMNSLCIVNDGAADLTFSRYGYFVFNVKPGETFDEVLDCFDELTVTATGPYRGFVRRDDWEWRSTVGGWN